MTAFVIAGALSWIGRWYQPGGEYTPEQIAEQCIATLCEGVAAGRYAARPGSQTRAQARRTANERKRWRHRRQRPTDAVFAATRGRRRARPLPVAALTLQGLKQLLDLAVKHAIRPLRMDVGKRDSYNRAAGMAPCSVRCCTISSMNCSWLALAVPAAIRLAVTAMAAFAVQSDQERTNIGAGWCAAHARALPGRCPFRPLRAAGPPALTSRQRSGG